MKRLISVLTAWLLCCNLAAFGTWNVRAADAGQCGDDMFWTLEAGVLSISGIGTMWDYGFQETPWSESADKITGITMESGVLTIGAYAFSGCTNLTEVQLSPALCVLSDYALAYCPALTSVTLPESLRLVEDGAFSQSGLTGIAIPQGVTALGNAVFDSCANLTAVALPDSLTTIGGPLLRQLSAAC